MKCFFVIAQVRVFDSNGAHDLDHFWLIQVCAHSLLLEVFEILHVHKLLELIHLIKLDPNGLLLESVLGFQDVLVEALGL